MVVPRGTDKDSQQEQEQARGYETQLCGLTNHILAPFRINQSFQSFFVLETLTSGSVSFEFFFEQDSSHKNFLCLNDLYVLSLFPPFPVRDSSRLTSTNHRSINFCVIRGKKYIYSCKPQFYYIKGRGDEM